MNDHRTDLVFGYFAKQILHLNLPATVYCTTSPSNANSTDIGAASGMYRICLAVVLSLVLCRMTFAASASEWRSRSIYQVLTDRFARTDGSTTAPCNTADRVYCGGTFKGIQNRLDYIQGAGFDAIWISPVTAQVKGDTAYGYAYHGYWQQDLYKINPHFGSAEDLKSLSNALHSRGMVSVII